MQDSSKPAILVVDDDEPTRRLYSSALRRSGYEVITATTGEDALRLLNDQQVACILLDSQMPSMSGPELVRELRSRTEFSLLPIIMVTGDDEITDKVTGLELGANDYLLKPVDLEELLARIRAHLRVSMTWADHARTVIQNRLAIVNALSAISLVGTPREQAKAVVEKLCGLSEVDAAYIYAFLSQDRAILLAGNANHASSQHDDLPQTITRRIWELAAKGPRVLEEEIDRNWWKKVDDGRRVIACPLGERTDPLGFLVLTDSLPERDDLTQLSLAIDIASAVQGLLGATLSELSNRMNSQEDILATFKSPGTRMVYQPIVNIVNQNVIGIEALARFGDGTPPDRRLKDARKAGIVAQVELELLRAAIRTTPELPADLWLSINLSAAVLVSHPELGALINDSRLPVVLEITEYEPIHDYDEVRNAFQRLPPLTRLAVDDAGAGYSSLRHVRELRPSYVKLDREWVAEIENDLARQALVESLVSFARRCNSELIAEGVETPAELQVLADLGVTLAQGYLLGRPTDPPGEGIDLPGQRLRSALS